MEDLVFYMTYGFFSFYFAGRFLGLRDDNLKNVALLGLALGGVRDFTGKTFIQFYFHK